MKKSVLIFAMLVSMVLGACAEPNLITGQTRSPIKSEEVVIYFIDRPGCNFETVAHIRVAGYYSLQSMFENMRQQAAEVGASGLYVLHTQQLDMKEYLGSAKAIRCLPA